MHLNYKIQEFMKKTTEQESLYNNLENQTVLELLNNINKEDQTVAQAVQTAIPQIATLATAAVELVKKGGRLFYIGAGTSGRLGVLDASECPPTFGVPFDMVVGIIAGGDTAIRKAVENAEDNTQQAWLDLQQFNINKNDVLVGIAASGSTPYVIGGLQKANEMGILTGCIVCNSHSQIAALAKMPIEIVVGPEFLTGSTRMKAGTAQKMALNMLSTTIMIKLGKVKGNRMVDMQLTNHKLVERGVQMIINETGLDEQKAQELLTKHGSVRKAVDGFLSLLH